MSPSPLGRSRIDARGRAFPPEQFVCSKSAWVTRHSERTDLVSRTSDVQAEDTAGGATATCVESCFGLGFGGTATPEHEYFFCRPPPFPEALHPWPLARNSYATAERGSFVLPNTEHTRRYDEPDKLPSVAVVLARRRRKGESYVCDRGEVVRNVEGSGSCCEARGLSFTMKAFHPSYSGVRSWFQQEPEHFGFKLLRPD